MPLSVGLFVFRDFITEVLLGSQWHEAAWFIGIWGLTSGITIVLSFFCSEVLRAKGKPRLSTISQLIDLVILIPVVWYGVHQSFDFLCSIRAFSRIFLIIPILLITYYSVKISPWKMLANINIPVWASILMGVAGMWFLTFGKSVIWNICSFVLCTLIYLSIVFVIPKTRHDLLNLKSMLRK